MPMLLCCIELMAMEATLLPPTLTVPTPMLLPMLLDTVTNGANTASIAGLAPAAVPAVAGGYAGAGRYVANSAGVVHVAKRSADAEPEADAYYGVYGYGGYGLGYAGYAGYAGYGYPAYSAYSGLYHGAYA